MNTIANQNLKVQAIPTLSCLNILPLEFVSSQQDPPCKHTQEENEVGHV